MVEELIKGFAASTENHQRNRFWLITLFGIWEFALVKPLWGLAHSQALEGWSAFSLIALAAAGFVALLMHAVTAEIYAFRVPNRIPLAIAISWIIHTIFNESVDAFGTSAVSVLTQLLVLIILFWALWPRDTTEPNT